MTSTRHIPIIRIEASRLLYNHTSPHLFQASKEGNNGEIISFDAVERITEDYITAWKPHEQEIIDGIIESTGLAFRRNVIDVHIAPYFGAFSFPLIIGTRYRPDTFIDVLTHEIIHNILWDNTSVPLDFDFQTHWKKVIPENVSFLTRVHILVHAVHKHIYLDVLSDENRYIRELEQIYSSDAEAYKNAWDYVEQHGDKAILAKLQNYYNDLNK